MGEGIAGFVAKSGEIVNIEDVQSDPRFKSDFDKASGYETKNMLCFPISNKEDEIIGVLQLLNSTNGKFSEIDEGFLSALSIHAALALENAELVEKLLKAERVSSLGKMANFLIQDIKKPILVSKRYAEHMKSKELPEDAVQVVDMLLEQITQVADLVQSTSSYAEGKTILRTVNTSLNKTLEDFVERLDSFVESNKCELLKDFDKDVKVKIDSKEFFQGFQHIIKNACEAMPEGGNIYLTTKQTGNEVKISFKDSGLGISDLVKDKIFEPFMSHGKKEGTGLGLTITKNIVEAHDGKIEVESMLGSGTTVTISLPVSSAL
jgi:signal transduction histidine kinase